MIGNGSEEGLMLQVRNPSHTDPGRTAVPGGMLVGGIVGYALSSYGVFFGSIVGLVVASGVGIVIYRWLVRRAARREAAQLEAAANERRGERHRQLVEARKSGAFDRFETTGRAS